MIFYLAFIYDIYAITCFEQEPLTKIYQCLFAISLHCLHMQKVFFTDIIPICLFFRLSQLYKRTISVCIMGTRANSIERTLLVCIVLLETVLWVHIGMYIF